MEKIIEIENVENKLKELLKELVEFSASFRNVYANKVKVAEASHINYTNLIVASKQELADLEKKKETLLNETLKSVEIYKAQMATEKENFNRIMKQEEIRLEEAYKKFDQAKHDYELMEKETIRLNQEAKAVSAKAQEEQVSSAALKSKHEGLVKRYEGLLSSVSQQKIKQDNAQKKIDSLLLEAIKGKEDIDAQQQILVSTSNALIAKENELKDLGAELQGLSETLAKEELRLKKLAGELAVQQENMDKEKEVITRDRSNLAAKEANLKQLEQELLDQKK